MPLIFDSEDDVRETISTSNTCLSNKSIHSSLALHDVFVHTLAFLLSSSPVFEYQLEHAISVLT